MIINQVVSSRRVNLEDFNVYKIDQSSITITPPAGAVSNVTSANIYFCTGRNGDAASCNFTIVGPVELLDSNGDVVETLQVQWVQDNYPSQGDIEITLDNNWVLDVTGCDTIVRSFGVLWADVMTSWTAPRVVTVIA